MPDPATPATLTDFLSAFSSIGTVVAAGFAAWGTWIARSAAKIAQAGVDEAKQARKAQMAPRLVLERNFQNFRFSYAYHDAVMRLPEFLATPLTGGTRLEIPSFSLTNYGEGAALELQIVFEFEDPNGDFVVSSLFEQAGLSIVPMITLAEPETFQTLRFMKGGNAGGSGLPLYRKMTLDLPNCAPGQTRNIEFPTQMLNTLFLRGLQAWDRRLTDSTAKEIILVVRISCHTVEGDPYATQFRFAASPFWQGESAPLIVYGHFKELPMFETIEGNRVA